MNPSTLTKPAVRHSARPAKPRWRPQLADRVLGSDPGLLRLFTALQVTVTIALAMLAEWLFVHRTHALELTAPVRSTTAQAALIAAQHHGITVIAIMLGAIVSLMATMSAGMFPTRKLQLQNFALMPVQMVAGLAVGLALAPYRVLALTSLVVVLAAGAYLRRFGPLGFAGGQLVFMGDFFGFFLHSSISLSGLGWLTAEIVVGVVVALVTQFVLFYPHRGAALRRMQRSYRARARAVAAAAVELFDADPAADGDWAVAARRLHRQLVRLNETALMIDAQLTNPAAVPTNRSATQLHQQLFDAELALTNAARFAERIAKLSLPAEIRNEVRSALVAISQLDLLQAELSGHQLLQLLATAPSGVGPAANQAAADAAPDGAPYDAPGGELPADAAPVPPGSPELPGKRESHGVPALEGELAVQVVLHRFAVSAIGISEAIQASTASTASTASPVSTASPAEPSRAERPPEAGTGNGTGGESVESAFTSQVTTMGGWLPGSALVSAAASLETGPAPAAGDRRRLSLRIGERVALAPHLRVSIQIAVAVTAAVILGDLISGRRFYWAVIAAFVTFMGANNSGEQVRKGALRIGGTVVGVLLGATLAHLVGPRTSLANAVILIALFLGIYLMRVNYAFMVVGVTVMVSQLYVQLDEFSNSLLLLRLEETALGASIAALTVFCVLPLRSGRVLRVAARHYVQALGEVAEQGVQRLLGDGDELALRAAARRLDASFQSLTTTLRTTGTPWASDHDETRTAFMQTAAASRHYARNLLIDTSGTGSGGAALAGTPAGTVLASAGVALAQSVSALVASMADAPSAPTGSQAHARSGDGLSGDSEDLAGARTYVRVASLFDVVATSLDSTRYSDPTQLALRDLQLIDGSLAALARAVNLPVQALDVEETLQTRVGRHARA